jgi:hypothetical protein
VEYHVPTPYKNSPTPWFLDPKTHDTKPPPLSTKHEYFCKCMWERISPPPPPTHNLPLSSNSPWSIKARYYLSILWFHGQLHEGYGPFWRSGHYHESLSLLLGYRVEQYQVFQMLTWMRNELPQEWMDAAKFDTEDEEVLAIFDELSGKWLEFFRGFELYQGLVVEGQHEGDDGLEDGAGVTCESREGSKGQAYWPRRQSMKIEMLRDDVKKSLELQGLWKPVTTRAEMVGGRAEVGYHDFDERFEE